MVNKFKHALVLLSICSLVACSNSFASPPLAFPEAQGYGKFTVGGRGGQIIIVDSLEDSEKARPGTLRYAAKAKGPRIVVFTVSGAIQLVKPLEIKEDFITIAGQTSPGGIVVTGSETQIDASQVIIRYIKFRPGGANEEGDAINAKRQSNIIIDHCSMSWANDEVASFYNNTNFTLQYSIVSESLNNAGHKKGSHGYGGIWGGKRASFIYNVVAHHTSRNPRINGYRLKPNYEPEGELVDVRYNTIYNWQSNSAYGNEDGKVNFVDNVFKQGPAKSDPRFFLIEQIDKTGKAFFKHNIMMGYPDKTADNMLGIEVKNAKNMEVKDVADIKSSFQVSQPFMDPHFPLDKSDENAHQAYDRLIKMKEVGANRNRQGKHQDSVDNRVLSEVATASATVGDGIIDSELQVISSWDAYLQEFVYTGNSLIPSKIDRESVQAWIDQLGQFSY